MSFKPFNIKYTPPPTVEPLLQETSVLETVESTTGSTSIASKLISQIQDLIDTNSYLQQLILNNNKNLSITFNPAIDPDTIKSLSQIYKQSVNYVTPSMYSDLLTAKMNALQISIAVGSNSSVIPNPYELGDLIQVTNSIQSSLASSGDYQSLQLAYLDALKGDALVMSNLQTALNTYPAVTNTGTKTDVSPTVNTNVSNMISGHQSAYASAFTLMTVDNIAEQSSEVIAAFLDNTGTELVQMATLFAMARSMRLKQLANSLLNGLTGFVLIRLLSELCPMMVGADRIYSQAVSPIYKFISGIDGILNSVKRTLYATKIFADRVKQAKNIVQTGSATGVSRNSTILGTLPHNSTSYTPQNTGLSTGLQKAMEAIDWAQMTVNQDIDLVNSSFNAASLRRLSFHSQYLDVMALMQAVTSVEVMIQASRNSSISTGYLPTGEALSALSATQELGSNSNIMVNTLNNSTAPAMASNVKSVLTSGGAKITSLGVNNAF